MNEKSLGKIDCPVCGFVADLKETKKGKAYVTCGECGSQTFARGFVADSKLRGKINTQIEQTQERKPVITLHNNTPKIEAQKPNVTEAEKPKAEEAENTIFDMLGGLLK